MNRTVRNPERLERTLRALGEAGRKMSFAVPWKNWLSG